MTRKLKKKLQMGKKSKMTNKYNKKYLENFHFAEATTMFMMLTRIIDVKTNLKEIQKPRVRDMQSRRKQPTFI